MRAFALEWLTRPPFPERVSAHVARVAPQSVRWAADLGLVGSAAAARRLGRANAAELAGRACPDAGPEQLRLLADLFTWLFSFDDRCDDDGLGGDPARLAPVVGQLLGVLDRCGGPAPPGSVTVADPAAAGLHDLCARVRTHGPPRLLLRFAAQMREYLLALLWEAANRERARVPALAEYLQMRRHTAGVRPSFTLTDLAYGGLAEATCRADLDASHLDDLAVDLVCWCNDVFSYAKERRQGRDGHNLIVVLARAAGREEQAGLHDAARRFNTGLRAYLELESALLAGGDPDTLRFVTARRAWIRGSYDWSLGAGRYR
ncbi:terpene synthase [Micromonospora sp. WMMD1102]|uniref:terpene synthase family protein n=1 Tax=Micromonospora sp. WMMD1102 TaxID=3016105 RepID=UPI00241573DA|nr:terpene synthase [Micromonospora sp. WMMD1102]MDG4788717.1 terpene synthase [Micromonospora sp. WMMD1102]